MSAGGPRTPAVVAGFHPVRELLRHRPHEIAVLYVGAGRGGGRRREIERLAQRHGVPVEEVSRARLNALVGPEDAVHNGFVAALSQGPSAPRRARGEEQLVVLLEDVQDPRNLGALLRVCEGAGVGRVLIRDRGSAPLGQTAAKAAAGAVEWLRIERIPNSAQAIQRLQADGYWIFGADASGTPPWELDLSGPILLCFGGEGSGLRRRTRGLCDHLVGLPMRGRIESLNVATAAAAILFEAVRQRTSSDASPEGAEPR